MNTIVINNYLKLKPVLFFLPLSLLATIVLILYSQNSLSVDNYVQIQKNCFFFLNSKLSQFPAVEYNFTQLGDASVFLSFLSIFIIYAPKMWESLISASIIGGLFSCILKKSFAVPRPSMMFDNKSFTIIGKALCGSNSLPSGHSITIFAILTVLLFAFIPQKRTYKILWFSFIIATGLLLVFTRVGIGAHYPLDVIIASIIGYISGLLGIFISRKYKIWSWIKDKRYYPVFILLFIICCICIVNKIIHENLIIFYLSFISLLFSLSKIIIVYVKK